MKGKQIDIFGGEVDLESFKPKPKPRSIKDKFRAKYGFLEGFKCGDCYFCEKVRRINRKHYYKCAVMGDSFSSATDYKKDTQKIIEKKKEIIELWGEICGVQSRLLG